MAKKYQHFTMRDQFDRPRVVGYGHVKYNHEVRHYWAPMGLFHLWDGSIVMKHMLNEHTGAGPTTIEIPTRFIDRFQN